MPARPDPSARPAAASASSARSLPLRPASAIAAISLAVTWLAGALSAQEVTWWNKSLDEDPRIAPLDARHGGGDVRGTLILHVVPVHGREHHIIEAPLRNRRRHPLRLLRVQRRRAARGLYVAKPARTRARIAHQHDCSRRRVTVAAAPALAEVRTSRLFADCRELQLSQTLMAEVQLRRGRHRAHEHAKDQQTREERGQPQDVRGARWQSLERRRSRTAFNRVLRMHQSQ